MLSFILQYGSNFRSILAKMLLKKQLNSHYFYPFMPWCLSIFKPRTCILHHFAFLVWLPTRIFSTPISHFQPLKNHFLMTISHFSAMFFMVRRGFVYTIAVDIYAFRLAFSSILHCVQHQNALRLAPKRTPFSGKTHRIQRHIAVHLASKRTAFSGKLPQNGCKWRCLQINIHFTHSHANPLFAS